MRGIRTDLPFPAAASRAVEPGTTQTAARRGPGRASGRGCRAVLAAALLVLAASGRGSEKLLREALRKDDTLGDISERYGQLAERQEHSRVFDAQEVEGTSGTRENLDTARGTAMKAVIDVLSSGLAADAAADQVRVRAGARQHYLELLELLRRLHRSRGEELDERRALRDLLEEQEQVLGDTRQLEAQLAQRPVTAEHLNRFADLAERQERLRKSAPGEVLQEPMRQAEQALSALKAAAAIPAQEEAVRRLRAELASQAQGQDQTQNGLQALVQKIEELNLLARDLERVEGRLREQARRQQPPPPRFQQETAVELDAAAQKLRQVPLATAAQAVLEAIPKQMAEEWTPAADKVKTARDQLEEARLLQLQTLRQAADRAEAEKQQTESQPDQPQPNAVTPATENQPRPTAAAAPKPEPKPLDGWQARLPARDRDALLAAREAAFDPKWEEEVKRYFMKLAE